MKRALPVLMLLAAPLLAGCLREHAALHVEQVRFAPGRILATLSERAPVERVALYSAEGAPLLRRGFAGRETARLRVDFPWRAGARYRLVVEARGRAPAGRAARAPEGGAAPFRLELEIPHGLATPLAFLPGVARLDATVKVTSGAAAPGGFRVALRLPEGVAAGPLPESVSSEGDGRILAARGSLTAANDVWFRQIPLALPASADGPLAFEALLRPDRGGEPLTARTEVRLRSAAALARSVVVERTALPTDDQGENDPLQLAGTLLLPGGPGQFLLRLLGRGGAPVNPYIPYRYQTVWLRNPSEGSVAVALSARTLTLDGRREVPFLRAPDLTSGGTGRSVAFAVLPPGETTRVVLPIFLDPRRAREGRYLRRLSVGLWGTRTELRTLDLPIELRRPSLRAFLVTLATLGVALLGALFLVWRGGRLFRRLPLRLLSGAATFAAALFVLVSIPEFVVGNLSRLLLGPFSFLLANLFSGVPLYALAVAYLMRYPVPGALGLLVTVRKIILALTLHSFQIIPFLMLGAEIVVLEGVAWLAGITRGPAGARLLDRWPRERWRPVLLAGGAFVLADVLLTGASFHLHIFFYRLVFADWYIGLYLAVSSVLYTFLGVALGFRLGALVRGVAA